jgi:hypothetical protein
MEEFQLLVNLLKDLPSMALWVIAGFWVYKVIWVGSVFGIVRLAVIKTHDWLTREKVVKTQMLLGGTPINDGVATGLQAQFMRLCSGSPFIHASDVSKLQQALDDYFAKYPKK